jgi:NitT/TauT family transport system substrate-binding protein
MINQKFSGIYSRRFFDEDLTMRKRTAAILFGVFVFAILASPATSQTTRIAALGLSAGLLPLWIAQDKRLFEQYGGKTEVITFQGGSLAVQALLAGEVRFAATGASAGVNAKLNGADLIAIAETVNTLPFVLVVKSEIDKPEMLKGKKIAVSRFGSLSYYAARLALSKMKLDPDKDVQLLQIGNEPLRLAALRQGSVDSTAFTPPYDLAAKKLGFRILTSFQEAGVQYSFDHLLTSKDYGNKNREMVSRFLKGYLHGIAFMKKQRRESIEILKKWTRLTDEEAVEASYDYYSKIIPMKPFGSEEGWKNLIESLSGTNPQGKVLASKDLFDYSFLREIDKSGFIEQLYR